MPGAKWNFLGEGAYNKAYRSRDGKEVLKIQKSNAETDAPERSVRLWNAINSHVNPPARLEDAGWVCPYIQGTQASDAEMAHALIDIYNKTGRIVVDAVAPKNFVRTYDGQVLCVDIGMALQLELRENRAVAAVRRKSIISIDVWSQLKPDFEPFFKAYLPIYPQTVQVVKALVFIKYNRPDIYNADFLIHNPQLIRKLAKAYDAQHVRDALAHLDRVELSPALVANNSPPSEEISALSLFSSSNRAVVEGTPQLHRTPLIAGDSSLSEALASTNEYFSQVEKNLIEEPFKSLEEKQLFERGKQVVEQVMAVIGEQQDNLSQKDIRNLTDILSSTKDAWRDRDSKEPSVAHAQRLADLSQEVSGKSSLKWNALGLGLLAFACLALVVVGVLAAIPTGGGSMLLTAIGAAGLATSVAAGVGVAAAGVAGVGALIHGREKGLARSVSQFKECLSELKNEKAQQEDLSTHHNNSV